MQQQITWRELLAIARRVRRSATPYYYAKWWPQFKGLIRSGQWVKLPSSSVTWRKPTVLVGGA